MTREHRNHSDAVITGQILDNLCITTVKTINYILLKKKETRTLETIAHIDRQDRKGKMSTADWSRYR